MQLASSSSERQTAQPWCLGTNDSQRLLPQGLGGVAPTTQGDRASVAPPRKSEAQTLEGNAIGIATVWLAFYVIARVVALAYQGSELLSQSLEIALLH
jgi:hypothetical protein